MVRGNLVEIFIRKRVKRSWVGEEYSGAEKAEENEILVLGWATGRNGTRRSNINCYHVVSVR